MLLALKRIYNRGLSKRAIVLPAANTWGSPSALSSPRQELAASRARAGLDSSEASGKAFCIFFIAFFFFFNFLPQKDSSLSEQEFPFKVAGEGSPLLQDFTDLILLQQQMLRAFARSHKQEQ